jgi:hypothetical protein
MDPAVNTCVAFSLVLLSTGAKDASTMGDLDDLENSEDC